jgi:integrase
MPEHVAAFTKLASPELCQALMLAMHTGQRQSDLLMLPWSAYDGERISLRQRKTMRKGKGGVVVSIRCTAALKRMLDGIILRNVGRKPARRPASGICTFTTCEEPQ